MAIMINGKLKFISFLVAGAILFINGHFLANAGFYDYGTSRHKDYKRDRYNYGDDYRMYGVDRYFDDNSGIYYGNSSPNYYDNYHRRYYGNAYPRGYGGNDYYNGGSLGDYLRYGDAYYGDRYFNSGGFSIPSRGFSIPARGFSIP